MFHAAAVIHPTSSTREFFDVNVGGTQNVLDRARRSGASRFVHVSSNSPFGVNATPDDVFTEDSPYDPYLGYGQSKYEAEQLVQKANDRGDVATVMIRAPWFYGPYQPARQSQFFRTIRRGRFPLVGDGTQRRSMAYTDNLVQGLLRAEVADKAPGQRLLGGRRRALRAAGDPGHGAPGAGGRGPAHVRTRHASGCPGLRGPAGRDGPTSCCRAGAGTSSRCTCSAS